MSRSTRPCAALVLVLAALCLSALALAFASAPAGAVELLRCTGSDTVHYSPGLTLRRTLQTVSYENDYSSCLSSDPTLTSGELDETVQYEASCLEPLGGVGSPLSLTNTIVWDNGNSTTYQGSYTLTYVGGSVIATVLARVVSGQFLGGTVVHALALTQLSGLTGCLTPPGVTTAGGPLALSITSP
jgi:hypothetical protein